MLIVWQNGMYTGDDYVTLFAVAQGSVESTFQYYVRPIEYAAVRLANAVWLPLWIPFSVTVALWANCIHARTVEIVTGRLLGSMATFAVIVGSPLWFYLVSEVDTVSQAVCNLLFAFALNQIALLLFRYECSSTRAQVFAVNASCVLLVFTKELALASAFILPAIAAIQVVRQRAWNWQYALSFLAPLLSITVWVLIKFQYRGMLPEADGRLNMTPGLADVLRNTIATIAFPITPIPTSILSISVLRPIWIGGALLSLGAAFILMRRYPWSSRPHQWFAVAVAGSCLPIFYIHASELYASMIGALFVGILAALYHGTRAVATQVAIGSVLLLCSYMNAALYFGHRHLAATGLARSAYSIYYGPNGIYFGDKPVKTICAVRDTRSVSWLEGHISCRTQ